LLPARDSSAFACFAGPQRAFSAAPHCAFNTLARGFAVFSGTTLSSLDSHKTPSSGEMKHQESSLPGPEAKSRRANVLDFKSGSAGAHHKLFCIARELCATLPRAFVR
jgi:hypothetical protein